MANRRRPIDYFWSFPDVKCQVWSNFNWNLTLATYCNKTLYDHILMNCVQRLSCHGCVNRPLAMLKIFVAKASKRTNCNRRSMKCILYECCNAIEQMKSDGEKQTEPWRKKDKREAEERKRNCDMPSTNGPQVGRPLDSSGSLDCGLSCQSPCRRGSGNRCFV